MRRLKLLEKDVKSFMTKLKKEERSKNTPEEKEISKTEYTRLVRTVRILYRGIVDC